MTSILIPLGMIFIATWVGAFGALYLKKGSSISLKKIFTNFKLIFGLSLYGLASAIFIYALKFGELSILYPMTALSYIWVAILSYYLLKEKITKQKLAGIALIIIGVALLALK